MTQVLETLLAATMTHDRAWTAIGCDGQPYLLASKLIDRVHQCPVCKILTQSLVEFTQHISTAHPNEHPDADQCRLFRHILLLPGPGHYEINMVKGIFKLLWDIILVELAKILGFKSTRALEFCQSASDLHKSWEILLIFLEGTLLELVLPYCRECKVADTYPSVAGYYA